MNLRRTLATLALLFALPVTATFAAPPAKPAAAAPVAGVDYEEIEGGQPFAPVAGKIEVAEAFGYTCGHCANFEPGFAAWKARQPKDVNVVPVAAPFGGQWLPYARAYYTAEALGAVARTHAKVFDALHKDGTLPISQPSIDELASFYAGVGVDRARFISTFNSPAVEQRMKQAYDFLVRSGVDATPMLVVNGKYRVIGGRSQAERLRIVEQLVARERARLRR